MTMNRHFSVLIAGALLLGTSIGCDVHGQVQISGSNHGHIKYDVKVQVPIMSWSIVGDNGGTVAIEPQYSLDFQGYPYNRIVLTANSRTTDSNGSTTITPMQLMPGSQFPVAVTTTGLNRTYNTTVESRTDLPLGSYVLNAPGLVQDLAAVAAQYPNSPMQIVIPGSYSTAVLPANSKFIPLAQSDVVNSDIVISFTASEMAPWVDLYTESPYLPPHPGPVTPTQD